MKRLSERAHSARAKTVILSIAVLGMLTTVALIHAEGGDALFIDPSGRIGIGTNAPGAQLDVAGKVKAKGFETDSGVSLDGVQKAVNRLVPVGTIMAYGGDITDSRVKADLLSQGWLPCDGGPYSADDGYAELYAAIGTAFGGDANGRRFNVPDLRGRFVRGADNSAGQDPGAKERTASNTGGNTGDRVGTIQEDAFRQHTHQYRTNIWFWSEGTAGGRYARGDHATDNLHTDTTDQPQPPGNPKETRPKNISVNWIIKARYTLPAER